MRTILRVATWNVRNGWAFDGWSSWPFRRRSAIETLASLAADVVGRLVVRPGELEAGLVVAVVGAPVLLLIVRRSRAVAA